MLNENKEKFIFKNKSGNKVHVNFWDDASFASNTMGSEIPGRRWGMSDRPMPPEHIMVSFDEGNSFYKLTDLSFKQAKKTTIKNNIIIIQEFMYESIIKQLISLLFSRDK